MKINSISLKNIGVHKDFTIKIDDNITAIMGKNGSGKSTLLESVVACFYGVFPSRPNSIYEGMTEGYNGDSNIEIEFSMNGKEYKAGRYLERTTKTTSAVAYLTTDDGFNNEVKIAGPKITDFERAIVNLIGDRETFMASVFASQGNAGDLTDAKPSERKAVFSKMLGFEKYDEICQKAKDKANGIENELEVKEMKNQMLQNAKGSMEETQIDLKLNTEDRDKAIAENEAHKANTAQIEEEYRQKSIKAESVNGLRQQRLTLDIDISTMEAEIATDRKEWQRLNELSRVAVSAKDLEDSIKIEDVSRETLVHNIEQLQESKDLIDKENMKAVKGNAEKGRLIAMKAMLQDQARQLDQTPKQECCNNCPLVNTAVRAIEELKNEQYGDWLQKMAEIQDTDILTRDIATAKLILTGIDNKISYFRKDLAEANKVQEYTGKMKAIAEAGVSKKAMVEQKKINRETISQQIDGFAGLENEITKLQQQVREQKDIHAGQEYNINAFNTRIGVLKDRLINLADAMVQAEELEKEIKAHRQILSDYKTIAQAFGRSGIQPLLLESIKPELEQIANELLSEITGGTMSIRISTQKELKSGEQAETLDIIITCKGNEMEVSRLSGGEKKLIKTCLRLAISIWQARKGGSRLKTIFLDEITEAMDNDNREKTMMLLNGLRTQFDRVIIISHDDKLLADIPSKISLT